MFIQINIYTQELGCNRIDSKMNPNKIENNGFQKLIKSVFFLFFILRHKKT